MDIHKLCDSFQFLWLKRQQFLFLPSCPNVTLVQWQTDSFSGFLSDDKSNQQRLVSSSSCNVVNVLQVKVFFFYLGPLALPSVYCLLISAFQFVFKGAHSRTFQRAESCFILKVFTLKKRSKWDAERSGWLITAFEVGRAYVKRTDGCDWSRDDA